jgi:hypothetical protein
VKVNFTWKLDNLPRTIDKSVSAGLAVAAQVIVNGVKEGFGSNANRGPSSPGQPPNSQRGGAGLKGSIKQSAVVARRTSVFTTFIYARTQEKGGWVTAKPGGFLTIPLSDKAKTRSRMAKGARGIAANTLILRSKRGNLIVFEKRGKRKPKLIPHYLLRKAVYLPARPFMRPGFMKSKDLALREFVRVASQTMQREIAS